MGLNLKLRELISDHCELQYTQEESATLLNWDKKTEHTPKERAEYCSFVAKYHVKYISVSSESDYYDLVAKSLYSKEKRRR